MENMGTHIRTVISPIADDFPWGCCFQWAVPASLTESCWCIQSCSIAVHSRCTRLHLVRTLGTIVTSSTLATICHRLKWNKWIHWYIKVLRAWEGSLNHFCEFSIFALHFLGIYIKRLFTRVISHTYLTKAQTKTAWVGITNWFSVTVNFLHYFHIYGKTDYLRDSHISHSCLAGVTTAQLWQHLSNMNVVQLMFGHGWVITSHKNQWMWLLIHVLISVNPCSLTCDWLVPPEQYHPGAHNPVGAAFPTPSQYMPGVQGTHAPISCCDVRLLKVPSGQGFS